MTSTDQTDPIETLQSLRKSIDNLDAAFIRLLAERFRCTQQVGELKKKHNLPPADPKREQEMIARLRQQATEATLDPDFAEKLIRFVIDEVIRHHERIKSGEE